MAALFGSSSRLGLRSIASASAPRAGFAGVAGVRYASKVVLPDLKSRHLGPDHGDPLLQAPPDLRQRLQHRRREARGGPGQG
ncbi:hypothetical protein KEM55_005761 [Ascosphaera atra]|nr:hypothetical protein KEM55_005761 [Ascosphaera atra]